MSDFNNKDLIHIKEKRVEYLKFRALEKYNNKIEHLITLRHGGVSKGIYSSLNFRTVGNDDIKNVFKNLEIVSNILNVDKNSICKAHQAHTDKILILDNNNKERFLFKNLSFEEYDGYITNKSNIYSLVTTADCNPVIIYDPILNIVSNIHSGWKGTLKNISKKAAIIMHENFNSNYNDMIVCIGPSIRSCCFTSKEKAFKKKFVELFQNEKDYIKKDNKRYYHFDLSYIITSSLLELGVKKENIFDSNICTCCNKEDFFSYRNANNNKEDDYGTFATIVGLKK